MKGREASAYPLLLVLLLVGLISTWVPSSQSSLVVNKHALSHDIFTAHERHASAVVDIAVADNAQHFITCGRDGSIHVFRVLMYPNRYLHRPYLFYGNFSAFGANERENGEDLDLVRCAMSGDQKYIYTIGVDHATSKRMLLQSFEMKKFVPEFPERGHMLKDHRSIARQAHDQYGFDIFAPWDEYNIVWKLEEQENDLCDSSSGTNKAQHWFDTEDDIIELAVAPKASRHIIAFSTGSRLYVKSDSECDFQEHQLESKIRSASFSFDAEALFIATESHIHGMVVKPNGKWTIERTLSLSALEEFDSSAVITQIIPMNNVFCKEKGNNARYFTSNEREMNKYHFPLQLCDCPAPQRNLLMIRETGNIDIVEYNLQKNANDFIRQVYTLPAASTQATQSDTLTIKMESSHQLYSTNDSAKVRHLASLSLDDRFLVWVDTQQNVLRMFHRTQPNGQFRSLTQASIYWEDETNRQRRIPHMITSVDHRVHFGERFINIGLATGERMQLTLKPQSDDDDDILTVPKCDPRARIDSFYLPPPPLLEQSSISSQDVEEHRLQDMELNGLFQTDPTTVAMLAILFVIILTTMDFVYKAESRVLGPFVRKVTDFMDSYIFDVACLALFGVSMFEIFFQSDFFNDWPAHLSHIRNVRAGILDYGAMMHYHGPCVYGGFFHWMYLVFYYLADRGLIQLFQVVWAVMEVLNLQLLRKILVRELRLPPLVALLLIASNRLHLYNVRVVVNDFPSVVTIHLALWFILQRRLALGAILYSLAVATKLNFIFYSPAVFVLYVHLNGYKIKSCVFHFSLMAIFQVVPAIPFLMANWRSYVAAVFDFGRTLLWEKTRSIKFVGRITYGTGMFNVLLLATISIIMVFIMVKSFAMLCHWHEESETAKNGKGKRIEIKCTTDRFLVRIFFLVNFTFVAFARGLYTPFLCWYLYSLPAVMHLAHIPNVYLLCFFFSHEILMRFWSNLPMEMYSTYILFLVNVTIVARSLWILWRMRSIREKPLGYNTAYPKKEH